VVELGRERRHASRVQPEKRLPTVPLSFIDQEQILLVHFWSLIHNEKTNNCSRLWIQRPLHVQGDPGWEFFNFIKNPSKNYLKTWSIG
jgi:hypothetical protein